MAPPAQWHLEPAEVVARSVGRDLVDRLHQERPRVGRPDDPEAVHDFRVALRRLRSWVRSFSVELAETVTPKLRRQLRRLADATGERRDLEVQHAWITLQIDVLNRRQHVGARWLLNRLEHRMRDADAHLHAALDKRYDHTHAVLVSALPESNSGLSDAAGPSAGAAVRRKVVALTHELESHLLEIRQIRDQDEAHSARIVAKRLRYLLEPFSGRIEGTPAAIQHLKSLQDALGELHDAQVFAGALKEALEVAVSDHLRRVSKQLLAWSDKVGDGKNTGDVRAGLLVLARLLHDRGERAFAVVQQDWLGGKAEPFLKEMRALAEAADPLGSEDVEIERKFLLSALPPEALIAPWHQIDQGWLPGTRLMERLRHVRSDTGDQWLRTVKLGSGRKRIEVEEETTREIYDHLWPLTIGQRVTKRRYRVDDGAFAWEIDQFQDRDLVLAEVELPTETTIVEPPAWLAPYVVREVTDDPAYLNRNLAT